MSTRSSTDVRDPEEGRPRSSCSGIKNVVAILPPGHTETPATLTKKPPSSGKVSTSSTLNMAVVFQKDGLNRFLSAQLREALPEPVPPTVGEMASAPEAELVSVVTGQGLFSQQLVQAQDGSSVLVLDPLPPQYPALLRAAARPGRWATTRDAARNRDTR